METELYVYSVDWGWAGGFVVIASSDELAEKIFRENYSGDIFDGRVKSMLENKVLALDGYEVRFDGDS